MRCACCGHDPDNAEAIEAALRNECERLGIAIFPGGLVNEAGAAKLLGKAQTTLRNRRLTDRPLECVYAGKSPRYSLRTLAATLATNRSELS